MGGLVGVAGPGSVGCQALPCVEAASHWLMGLGHEVAGFGTLGGPGDSTGSLLDRIVAQETLGLVPDHWWVSQVLGSGCRTQGSWNWCWTTGGWDQFLIQLAVGSGVFQSLCWPAGGQGWVLSWQAAGL